MIPVNEPSLNLSESFQTSVGTARRSDDLGAVCFINLAETEWRSLLTNPTKASLHMFRRTFGTAVTNKRGIEQARIWLGHEDVQTTQAYLAADEWVSVEDAQKKQQEIFEEFGD